MAVTTENGIIKPATPPPELEITSANDLMEMDLPPVEFIVEKILPTGLTLLVSPPKYGKSWACLDLGISVASGGYFMGHKCHKAGCLYLSLEDSNNRLRDRLNKILAGRPAPPELFTAISAPTMDSGLFPVLEKFLTEHPATKLVIIDTFQRVRGAPNRSLSAYASDYQDAGTLKHFADQHKIALLLVHHLRKMKDPSDPFSNISGTSGLLGASDTALVLSRKSRSDEQTTLSVTGRDVFAEDLAITFDKSSFRWKVLGTSEEIERQSAQQAFCDDPVTKTVLQLLKQNNGTWRGTTTELLSAGVYISGRTLATSAESLGRKLTKMIPDFREMLAVTYDSVRGKNGNILHVFSSATPFDK